MTFLLLNLLQTRTRISWVVIAAAVIALAAGIALLVYFYKRYKRIEKETEEDWDASRHSLFVSARPTQPKTELTDAAAPMEAEPPVSEREPVKAGGTREFASDLNLAAFTPAANVEPEPQAEAPAPEVPVPAQPPVSAEPRQTEILASPSIERVVSDVKHEPASFEKEIWSGLEDSKQQVAPPVTPAPLTAARVEEPARRETFEPPRLERMSQRESYESPSIKPLTPREAAAT